MAKIQDSTVICAGVGRKHLRFPTKKSLPHTRKRLTPTEIIPTLCVRIFFFRIYFQNINFIPIGNFFLGLGNLFWEYLNFQLSACPLDLDFTKRPIIPVMYLAALLFSLRLRCCICEYLIHFICSPL